MYVWTASRSRAVGSIIGPEFGGPFTGIRVPQDSLAEVPEELSTREGTFKAPERWSERYRGCRRRMDGRQHLNEDGKHQEKYVANEKQIVMPLRWTLFVVKTRERSVVLNVNAP